jgi:uncharacterized protein
MKALYIHGYRSAPDEGKNKALEDKGYTVIYDHYDYDDPNIRKHVFDNLLKQGENVDIIVGSSLGGYIGYWLSCALNKRAILFNPALSRQTVEINIPKNELMLSRSKGNRTIILGTDDDVVDPHQTIDWLKTHSNILTNNVVWEEGLEHRIPLDIFQKIIGKFA